MNKSLVKIFAIVVFVVIGMHFFHSEFDLFSSEETSEHHASHDYCKLIDTVAPSYNKSTVKIEVPDFFLTPVLYNYEALIKINTDELTTSSAIPKECPDYILNRTLLI